MNKKIVVSNYKFLKMTLSTSYMNKSLGSTSSSSGLWRHIVKKKMNLEYGQKWADHEHM